MFATRALAALFAAALTASAASAQPAPKADLIINDITFDSSDNEVKLKTRNVGEVKAENFRVRLQIVARAGGANGDTKVLFDQAKTFNRINPGDTEDEKFDVNFQNIRAQADAFKAELLARVDRLANIPAAVKLRLKKQINDTFTVEAVATADSDNQVAEKNENNNARTETVPAN